MEVRWVNGDLLDQPVEVIVNAWNRHLFPWWLLLPQGVSRAIKRRGGTEPFRELRRLGLLPLGSAVETAPGKLPFKAIIHVAGINLLWRSSEWSVRNSVRNALRLASDRNYRSIALPRIGAGSGGGKAERVERWIQSELESADFTGLVIVVRYQPRSQATEASKAPE
jgi:O-acetyl-ADP-ribose deacetylase (regulator of RNase III)